MIKLSLFVSEHEIDPTLATRRNTHQNSPLTVFALVV